MGESKRPRGRPRSKNPKEGTARVLVRILPELLAMYEREAERQGKSFNTFVNEALADRYAHNRKGRAA